MRETVLKRFMCDTAVAKERHLFCRIRFSQNPDSESDSFQIVRRSYFFLARLLELLAGSCADFGPVQHAQRVLGRSIAIRNFRDNLILKKNTFFGISSPGFRNLIIKP